MKFELSQFWQLGDEKMEKTFGEFLEPCDEYEYLVIHFSPTSMPLQQRWRNNGLSADFLSEYWATFLPTGGGPTEEQRLEFKGAVNYIANELLENVMKFSYEPADYPVSLGLYLFSDEFRFYTSNAMDPQQVDEFQQRVQRLLEEDPAELYLEQIEKNALGDGGGSQLGLLTMIGDYGATLSWRFKTFECKSGEATVVTTMVRLQF
ncbi:MAG TPA: ATP-binding protein [Anaerolineae bacterium]|nr:ATP-binding protein [Anaerolineae bacterium]